MEFDRDRAGSEQGTVSYAAFIRDPNLNLAEQLLEGSRLRIQETGRLLLPGMYKAYAKSAPWRSPLLLILCARVRGRRVGLDPLCARTARSICVDVSLLPGPLRCLAVRSNDPVLHSVVPVARRLFADALRPSLRIPKLHLAASASPFAWCTWVWRLAIGCSTSVRRP